MAAEAALRVGAGLVSVITRPEHVAAILARRPEIMVNGIDSAVHTGTSASQSIDAMIERADVIAIGPGLGRNEWAQALLDLAIAARKPLVVDADGLHLLKDHLRNGAAITTAVVLTPHVAEAAALLGSTVADVQHDRFATVKALAALVPTGAAVLKGAGSLVANLERIGVCLHGNPGMASAGMGDVLTGVIAGLLAQGLDAITAATAGVCLHSLAGDRVADRSGMRGLLATDLLTELRGVLNDLPA